MRPSDLSAVVAGALSFSGCVLSKAVFGHYMMGGMTEDHVHQDIDKAMAMGLDGFALNIGDPTDYWISEVLSHLFGYAEYKGFKLYVNMDMYGSRNGCDAGSTSCNGPFDYDWILKGRLGSSAWYKGPNGFPLVSTFNSGGMFSPKGKYGNTAPNEVWRLWKESYGNQIYFIPDFDDTQGYYDAAPGWYDYWGSLCDGLSSWETAWPGSVQKSPGDVSVDFTVLSEGKKRGKGYMIGLSLLQYKNSYGTNNYRGGDLNLPKRMQNILGMNPQPDFVQVITWNDGPEAHYIGNIWPEQTSAYYPQLYANPDDADHTGLQNLFKSFITAFKAGGYETSMTGTGNTAVGAMWHNPILKSTVCKVPSGLDSKYYQKPSNWDTATDNINWAIAAPAAGYQVRGKSGGKEIGTVTLKKGLNYGQFGPMSTGAQVLELLNNGVVVGTISGTRCVSTTCPDTVYNLNPQVAGLGGTAARACNSSPVYGQRVAPF